MASYDAYGTCPDYDEREHLPGFGNPKTHTGVFVGIGVAAVVLVTAGVFYLYRKVCPYMATTSIGITPSSC